ncbi:hypothetical protein BDW62DRAFT_35226 [Aspergillus aurantiobrunneus]
MLRCKLSGRPSVQKMERREKVPGRGDKAERAGCPQQSVLEKENLSCRSCEESLMYFRLSAASQEILRNGSLLGGGAARPHEHEANQFQTAVAGLSHRQVHSHRKHKPSNTESRATHQKKREKQSSGLARIVSGQQASVGTGRRRFKLGADAGVRGPFRTFSGIVAAGLEADSIHGYAWPGSRISSRHFLAGLRFRGVSLPAGPR